MTLRERLQEVQTNLAALKKSMGAKLLPPAVLETVSAVERLQAETVAELERLDGVCSELADVLAASAASAKGVRHGRA